MSGDALIASARFAAEVSADPIVLADVGARGEAEQPWRALSGDTLRVVGFEPDEQECERLNREAGEGHDYLPVALWSEPGRVPVHVAEFPGCSSVHPPDMEFLSSYSDEHWRPRRTVSAVEFDATTLDAVAADHDLEIDFLKVDTQGSEWEILMGARNVLSSQAFGAVVETWTAPVHEGQRLTGDVMTLMHEHGFAPFDVNVAAAWSRRATGDSDLGGKRQLMGLDVLFLRQPPVWSGQHPPLKLLKAAAIANAYGFPDYALEILAGTDYDWARQAVVDAARERVRRGGSLRGRIGALVGRPLDRFPSLHS
jgi:FkbM family methyltransferase